MATLTRFSTAKDIRDTLLENMDFDEGCGDLTKADKFITAARAWFVMNPQRATHGGRGGEEIVLNSAQIKALLDEAIKFRDAKVQQSGGTNRFFDVTDYRS